MQFIFEPFSLFSVTGIRGWRRNELSFLALCYYHPFLLFPIVRFLRINGGLGAWAAPIFAPPPFPQPVSASQWKKERKRNRNGFPFLFFLFSRVGTKVLQCDEGGRKIIQPIFFCKKQLTFPTCVPVRLCQKKLLERLSSCGIGEFQNLSFLFSTRLCEEPEFRFYISLFRVPTRGWVSQATSIRHFGRR